jgi:hypothetical protein
MGLVILCASLTLTQTVRIQVYCTSLQAALAFLDSVGAVIAIMSSIENGPTSRLDMSNPDSIVVTNEDNTQSSVTALPFNPQTVRGTGSELIIMDNIDAMGTEAYTHIVIPSMSSDNTTCVFTAASQGCVFDPRWSVTNHRREPMVKAARHESSESQ